MTVDRNPPTWRDSCSTMVGRSPVVITNHPQHVKLTTGGQRSPVGCIVHAESDMIEPKHTHMHMKYWALTSLLDGNFITARFCLVGPYYSVREVRTVDTNYIRNRHGKHGDAPGSYLAQFAKAEV